MAEPTHNRIEGYPVGITLPVQWGDEDRFGHVNNVVFLRWFESARVRYLQQCGVEVSTAGVGPILAAVHCNYRQQLKFPDTVVIGARLKRLGHSSLTVEHQVWSNRTEQRVADGESVIVMLDYTTGATCRITDQARKAICDLEESAT